MACQRGEGEDGRPQVIKFDGFDLPTVGPISSYRLRHFEHARYWHPEDEAFVKVYAQLGLHRYNFLEGTNYRFSLLQSYNRGMTFGAARYYLSLFADCPDSGRTLPFHALVSENRIGCLDISVHIARPRCSEEQPRLCRPTYTCSPLPRWPSSEMFAQRRFYTLNEHELRNTDWVRLYLDLAHSTCDRGMTESQLSDFYIEQVAIRSLSDADPPRLDSKSVVVYMVYKDLAKDRLGEPCYRKAIIRRVYDESSRSLTFQGKHWSFSEEKEKKKKKKRQEEICTAQETFRCLRSLASGDRCLQETWHPLFFDHSLISDLSEYYYYVFLCFLCVKWISLRTLFSSALMS